MSSLKTEAVYAQLQNAKGHLYKQQLLVELLSAEYALAQVQDRCEAAGIELEPVSPVIEYSDAPIVDDPKAYSRGELDDDIF